jgi:hypothetical protein
MLRTTVVASLVLATAHASAPGNLGLRGGGPVSFSKLSKGPGMVPTAPRILIANMHAVPAVHMHT